MTDRTQMISTSLSDKNCFSFFSFQSDAMRSLTLQHAHLFSIQVRSDLRE